MGYADSRLQSTAKSVSTADRDYLVATTPSELLRLGKGVFLVNGNFFGPWKDKGPFDYQPCAGQECQTATVQEGSRWFLASRGGKWRFETDQQFGRDAGEPIIYGRPLLRGGAPARPGEGSAGYLRQRHARCFVALNEAADRMIFIVVDGRQPGYSVGLSWEETAQFALSQDAWSAMMLDGGGSATMAVRDPASGKVRVLNCPIHNTIPGRE